MLQVSAQQADTLEISARLGEHARGWASTLSAAVLVRGTPRASVLRASALLGERATYKHAAGQRAVGERAAGERAAGERVTGRSSCRWAC